MTRPLQRRPDGTHRGAERGAARRAARRRRAAERMLELQQGAGNAALARVLAREPAADAPIQRPGPAFPSPWEINPRKLLPQLKPEVSAPSTPTSSARRASIRAIGHADAGPDRRDPPQRPGGGRRRRPAIKDRVHAIVPGVPATRAGASLGQKKREQEASIANRFPKPPTSVTVGNAKTYVKVEIVSAELKTPAHQGEGRQGGRRGRVREGRREGRRLGQVGRQRVRPQDGGPRRQVRRQGPQEERRLGLVGRPRGPALGRRGRRGARRRRRGRRRAHRARRVARPPAGRRLGHRRLRHRPDGRRSSPRSTRSARSRRARTNPARRSGSRPRATRAASPPASRSSSCSDDFGRNSAEVGTGVPGHPLLNGRRSTMQQDLNRRRFLGAAAGAGAAIAAGGALAPAAGAHRAAAAAGPGRPARRTNHVPRDRRGIQLYTLRDAMTNGDRAAVRRVLNALGRMGYTEVETAGHYGWETAKQFRSVLDARACAPSPATTAPDHDLTNTNWEEGVQGDARVRRRARPEVHGLRVVPRAVRLGRSSRASPSASTRRARWPRSTACSSSTTTTTSSSRRSRPTGRRSTTCCSAETDRGARDVRARPLLDHVRRTRTRSRT